MTPRPRRVAIGSFDGVHLGHADIVRGCDTVLSFDPHPLTVIAPDRAPRLLTSLPAKALHLARLGIRELVVARFDLELARQGPREWLEEMVIGRLGAVHVSVGSSFRYGAGRCGTPETLLARPEFTTRVGELVHVDGAVVSSTRIRQSVAAGDVEQAARLLGRPHGIPSRTADDRRLVLDTAYALPPPGVYLCSLRQPGAGPLPQPTTVAVEGADGWILEGTPSPPGQARTLELVARA